MLNTYLCGAIQCLADGGSQWRDKITPKLEALGINVLDPCKSECNKEFGETIQQSREQIKKFKRGGNWEEFDSHMDKVIHDDLAQVNMSQFLIVYWNQDYHHGGTVHEMAEAWNKHIPIYCVNYDSITGDKEMNDWVLKLVRTDGMVFSNFGQLITFLKVKYKKEIKDQQKQKLEKEIKKEVPNE